MFDMDDLAAAGDDARKRKREDAMFQTSDTPLCDALSRDPLDSNDMSAWHSLAYRLEKKLAALSPQPEAATIIGIDVATSAVRDAARYRWLRDAENHDNPVWRFLSLKGYDEKRMDALIDDELAKERHLPQPQRQAHSMTEYKRIKEQGGEIDPPASHSAAPQLHPNCSELCGICARHYGRCQKLNGSPAALHEQPKEKT